MKTLLLGLLILPFFALADGVEDSKPTCMHDNKPLPVGESVWVVDPHLAKISADAMRKKGYSEEAIAKEISRNDWVGYRLVCVKTFEANDEKNSKQAGDVLAPTGVALVLNEYSDDFYQHVLDNVRPSISF